ncbi:hypothetical protein GCM10007385_35710 [Tateyamaria omphalii]|uniref:hypothetical protein n=1 Tax=Tateyamaria omphalii TaxID=299262 RepID=UPI0016719F8A|nr:hypothetical protein [Tateyamaria omphalii]GGX63429.1 hypothetical protein GCM10007385_35710 [Tateyamaria omphalii]
MLFFDDSQFEKIRRSIVLIGATFVVVWYFEVPISNPLQVLGSKEDSVPGLSNQAFIWLLLMLQSYLVVRLAMLRGATLIRLEQAWAVNVVGSQGDASDNVLEARAKLLSASADIRNLEKTVQNASQMFRHHFSSLEQYLAHAHSAGIDLSDVRNADTDGTLGEIKSNWANALTALETAADTVKVDAVDTLTKTLLDTKADRARVRVRRSFFLFDLGLPAVIYCAQVLLTLAGDRADSLKVFLLSL